MQKRISEFLDEYSEYRFEKDGFVFINYIIFIDGVMISLIKIEGSRYKVCFNSETYHNFEPKYYNKDDLVIIAVYKFIG